MVKVTRAALLAVSFLVVVTATGSGDKSDRATLKGVSAFSVLVEGLNLDLERYGVTKKQLQTTVELRLRKAGLPVSDGVTSPYLYIKVNSMIHGGGTASISINVSFVQAVRLDRDPTLSTLATTWDAGGMASSGVRRLSEVMDHVGDLVDQFANDFLAVNPKR